MMPIVKAGDLAWSNKIGVCIIGGSTMFEKLKKFGRLITFA